MLAHGIGERGDLPLPVYLFIWGIGLAIVVSFIALGTLWTEPRLAMAAQGRLVLRRPPLAVLHFLGRSTAFALYLVCLYAAFGGFDAPDRNVLPVTLYVIVWVGGQLVGGLLGDLWAAINPIDTLARAAERVSHPVSYTHLTLPTIYSV